MRGSVRALLECVALITAGLGAAPASNAAAAGRTVGSTRPAVLGWGFNRPAAVSTDGTHVWVADYSGNSVTELDAATGAFVQTLSASIYGFDNPIAISSDGTHVWVANADQTVTTFPAT